MSNSRTRRKRAMVKAAIREHNQIERLRDVQLDAIVRRNLRGATKTVDYVTLTRDTEGTIKRTLERRKEHFHPVEQGAGYASSVTMVEAGPTRGRGKRGDTLYHQRDATRIAKTPGQQNAERELRRDAAARENAKK